MFSSDSDDEFLGSDYDYERSEDEIVLRMNILQEMKKKWMSQFGD